MTRDEQISTIREVVYAEWDDGCPIAGDVDAIAAVAVRRWQSRHRRGVRATDIEAAIEDLAKGLVVHHYGADRALVGPLMLDYRWLSAQIVRSLNWFEWSNVLRWGIDVAGGFDVAWAVISDTPPVAHDLKTSLRNRWVRFYNLPNGKRYATTDAERYEIRWRASRLLSALLGEQARVLVTSGRYGPHGEIRELTDEQLLAHTAASHWYQAPIAEGGDDWVFHVWASWETYTSGVFDLIIDLAANEHLMGVLIVDPRRRVAIHPYGGGIDVIVPTPAERSALRHGFAEWVSELPSGL